MTMGKVKTIQKKNVVRESASTKGFLINEVRKDINKNGYSIFGGAKSTLVKKCPLCGRLSMVGCISADKENIIAICFYRYYKVEKLRCIYNKKWTNQKAEEDRTKATTIPNAGV
jgi:hypothetical protein